MDIIPQSPYERMAPLRNDYNKRLRTFDHRWPQGVPVLPQDLAQDGFYYTGLEDKVQCTHCGGILSGWCEGEVVALEHRQYFPNCPWVRHGRQLQNGPSNVGDLSGFSLGHTVPTVNKFRYQQILAPNGVPGVTRPKFQNYAMKSARMASFEGWPPQIVQRPEMLCEAGFVYLGKGDICQCFFCGGCLRSWEPGDDPWREHARWFPKCPWINLVKGDQFVNNVQQKNQWWNGHQTSHKSTGGKEFSVWDTVFPIMTIIFRRIFAELAEPAVTRNLTRDEINNSRLDYIVHCRHCGGKLSGWSKGEVAVEHCQHFQNCPLVRHGTVVQNCSIPNSICSDGEDFPAGNPMPAGENFQNQRTLEPNDVPGVTPPKFKSFETESARKVSFKEWPIPVIQRPENLCKAGFFYIGEGDKCKCFYCGGILWDWRAGFDPWVEHAKWFPDCHWVRFTKGDQFVEDVQQDMVLLRDDDGTSHELRAHETYVKTADAQSSSSSSDARVSAAGTSQSSITAGISYPPRAKEESDRKKRGYDFPSTRSTIIPNMNNIPQTPYEPLRNDYNKQIRRGSAVQNCHAPHDRCFNVGDVPTFSVGQTVHTGGNFRYQRTHGPNDGVSRPKFQKYVLESERKNSFKGWPTQKTIVLESLCEAGFFYLGEGDKCKCFYCGGILSDWRAGCDPWVEHAKQFPDCLWVKMAKGDQFIEDVQQEKSRIRINDETSHEPFAEETYVKTVIDQSSSSALSKPSDARAGAAGTSQASVAAGTSHTSTAEEESDEKKKLESIICNLKEQKLCKICRDKEVGVLFEPCGHLCCCVTCAVCLQRCPICRKHISNSVRVYIA